MSPHRVVFPTIALFAPLSIKASAMVSLGIMQAIRALAVPLSMGLIALVFSACAQWLDYDDVEFQQETMISDSGQRDAQTDRQGDEGVEDGAITESESSEAESLEPIENTCENVDCGDFGHCVTEEQQAVCACDTGYHAQGLHCVRDDPCEGISCGNHAFCQDGQCVCEDGFEGDPTKGCTQPNPLEDQVRAELVAIAMAEKGYCEGKEDRPYMQAQPGYWCYDFVAWVYSQSSHPLPAPYSLPMIYADALPPGWHPGPGDLIKYDIQHYGMVAEVSADGSLIKTIEGNVNSCVVTRSTNGSNVEYYGSLEGMF